MTDAISGGWPSERTKGFRDSSAVGPVAVQGCLDELGRLLRETTFCVVDLETTGGSAAGGAMITEIGAVKVCGGEVLGEFASLVNPCGTIPPFIAVLTGITDTMVATAPRIEAVLPSFLEFARGAVLVAHNAPFDTGFLRHFTQRCGLDWPVFDVIDTARLARRVVTRDETPDCKLASLARLFGAATTPNHRALADARATVDVLHGLIERLGNLGVHTLEELATFSSSVSAAQRRKRHLAEGLPSGPGVYLFRDGSPRPLYIGTSRDLRARVRTYFTASETRSRMGGMVGLTTWVEAISCATALEAEIRELRLIAQHKPRYNRRSRHPERAVWVKLTVEPWPRLSLVRQVRADGADYLGPFGSRRTAEQAVAALHEAFRVRQCSGRLGHRAGKVACVLAEMARCLSPCDGSTDDTTYAAEVTRLRLAIRYDPAEVVAAVSARMQRLVAAERYEDAAVHRDRLAAFVRASARTQRLEALSRCPELVGAEHEGGRWQVHVVRHGRLAAAGVMPADTEARAWVATLLAGAETVVPGPGPVPAASPAETERLARWLERPGVRLVRLEGEWSCPVAGAARHVAEARGRESFVPFDEHRLPTPVHQPARPHTTAH